MSSCYQLYETLTKVIELCLVDVYTDKIMGLFLPQIFYVSARILLKVLMAFHCRHNNDFSLQQISVMAVWSIMPPPQIGT